MKYVIDIEEKPEGVPNGSCIGCPLRIDDNENEFFFRCAALGPISFATGKVFGTDIKAECPLIPVEEIRIENFDGDSIIRGYKEMIPAEKSLSEYKEKQMQNPEFREEYEKVIDELRKEIK